MSPYLASVIIAVISAGVAIYTNYWRTQYTARAQDFSKRLDEASSLITKIETLACEYWGSSDSLATKDIEKHIVGLSAKLDVLLGFLDQVYSNFQQVQVLREITEFSKACTGGTFDSERKSDPDRIRLILETGERLKVALLLTRTGLY